jgi:hypothetical protein
VAGARLSASVGVIVADLEVADITEYLERDVGDVGHAGAVDRRKPVVALLGKGGPVDLALRTPLMVELARTIDNPRGGEPIENMKNPAELCRAARFPDQTAIKRHLHAELRRHLAERR